MTSENAAFGYDATHWPADFYSPRRTAWLIAVVCRDCGNPQVVPVNVGQLPTVPCPHCAR